jgi:hypothetical protein
MLYILAESPKEQKEILAQKEKQRLIFPFCCWRFRPSKPYFIWAVKWSVLQVSPRPSLALDFRMLMLGRGKQFVVVKPLLAISAIIFEAFDMYCETSQSFAFANVYIEIIDFICVSVALYGLVRGVLFFHDLCRLNRFARLAYFGGYQILLYVLVNDELHGRRPLHKFMTIKIVSVSTSIIYGVILTRAIWHTDRRTHLLSRFHHQCFGTLRNNQGDTILARYQPSTPKQLS